MRDLSNAPDHVFRDELASFEDAPAWDAPRFTFGNARVVVLDGDELPEGIVVGSFDVRLTDVGEWMAGAIREARAFQAAMDATMEALGVSAEQLTAWADEISNAYAEPAWPGVESWETTWDGETLEPGCIADTEDSLEGGTYIPCGADVADGWDWCPAHLAAIRARTEDGQ